ncbi:MAG: Rieske (2Fe-2S) protein [Cytophagales bacterium]|nr:MAG: Rieske (2Fe-2S) protein [Cytophagales bacterium]
MNRKVFFQTALAGIGVICAVGCESKADDMTPDSDVLDLTIQLDDARYKDLVKQGFYVVVENRVVVAHVQPSQYVAVSPKCTHEGTTLAYNAASKTFVCSLDQSRYDLTGKVVNGPATKPLTVYSVANDEKSNSLRIKG